MVSLDFIEQNAAWIGTTVGIFFLSFLRSVKPKTEKEISNISKQLTPNGGSSIPDRVGKLETMLADLLERYKGREEVLNIIVRGVTSTVTEQVRLRGIMARKICHEAAGNLPGSELAKEEKEYLDSLTPAERKQLAIDWDNHLLEMASNAKEAARKHDEEVGRKAVESYLETMTSKATSSY